MRVIPTEIPEVLVIEPRIFRDERGFFLETFNAARYAEAGLPLAPVQDNCSGSAAGVLRGLHYQYRRPQGKLVGVTAGRVFDVAVDLRRSSATFGRWVGVWLSAEDRKQLWVPPGFAHGFYVADAWAEVTYKVTELYDPEGEATLLWNDPALHIAWPIPVGSAPRLSPKDALGRTLDQVPLFE